MANNCIENCQKNDLIVNLKARNVGRFKAGADLSGKVNLMNVEVTEQHTEEVQEVEIRLHLSSETCASVK